MDQIGNKYAVINGTPVFYTEKTCRPDEKCVSRPDDPSEISVLPEESLKKAELEKIIFQDKKNISWSEVISTSMIKNTIEAQKISLSDNTINKLYEVLIQAKLYDKNLAAALFKSIAKAAEPYTAFAYEELPVALTAIREAGITDPVKIVELLTAIASSAGKLTADAFCALPKALAVIKESITQPGMAAEMLTLVAGVSGKNTSLAFTSLSKGILAIKEAGITDPAKICELLKIIAAATGEDSGWSYTALPRAIQAIKAAGLTEPVKLFDLLKTIAAASGKNTSWAYTATPAIIREGITEPAKILDLLKTVADASGKNKRFAFMVLPGILEAGITQTPRLAEVLRTVAEAGGENPEAAFRAISKALPGILKNQKENFKNYPEKSYDNLKMLIQYAIKGPQLVGDNLAAIFKEDSLKFDISKFDVKNGTMAEFAKYLAECINNLSPDEKKSLSKEFYSKLAVLVNNFHESDSLITRTDSFRDTFCSTLNSDSIFFLLARGGADLYTSTFNKLYANPSFINSLSDFDKYISEPSRQNNKDDVLGLMLTLFQFKKVDIVKSSEKMVDVIIKALSEKVDDDKIITRTGLIVSGIMRMGTLASHYESLSEFLLAKYDKTNNSIPNGCLKYLIKQLSPQLKNEAITTIAGALPEVKLKPQMPVEKWLADKTITAKLYFYKDEKWYELTQSFYKKSGYVIDADYLKEKKLDTSLYAVYKKNVNGITLRVILTRNKDDDREAAINGKEVDIIVHRGHSYHLRETFPPDIIVTAQDKLIFGGSCGSFRDMVSGDFITAYRNNYLIADENTGQGDINNRLLSNIMNNAANKKFNWDDAFKEKPDGIVLPNEPAFLLGSYLNQLNCRQKQSGN